MLSNKEIYNNIAPLSELNKDKKLVLFYNLYAIRCNYPDGIRNVPKQSYAKLIENMGSDMEKIIKAFEIYF